MAGTAKARRTASRGNGRPTINDVARHAGVSAMTVSRVINRDGNVRLATRELVDAAIAELDYAPNPAARSLAGRGQCRIALLYTNPSSAFLNELLVGSLEQARESDAQFLLEPCDARDNAESLIERLRQHRIDGVIIPAPLCDAVAEVEQIIAAGFAVARIAATLPSRHGLILSIDNAAAGQAMTEHLIALGHRRIGFIRGGAAQPGLSASLRQEGYERALDNAGIARDPQLIAAGNFDYRSGLEAAEILLSLDSRPTAIFASNDDMAAAAVACAHRLGFDVPGDVSVTGFDDTAIAKTVWPELTTIRQPIADMAHTAVELLVKALRGGGTNVPSAAEHLVLPYALVTRDSAAPTNG